MGIAPGSATVDPKPTPEAELLAPNACAETGSTPVHAEITSPPSATGTERVARIARICSPVGLYRPLGKFCTFVATYVAIETPLALADVTSVYVLPTGVLGTLARKSVTDVMIPGGPIQKNVAIIASPVWGLVGLNPLTSSNPLSLRVPFHWSSAMPLPAVVASSGGLTRPRSGPAGSVQATASNATATRPRRPARVACLHTMPPPSTGCAPFATRRACGA